jgi:hypothetical protein
MSHRHLAAVALVVFLPLAGWLAGPAAAEPSGPGTPAAPAQCDAPAALFTAPAPLSPAPALLLTTAATPCGCGAASCIGKQVGDRCAQGLICASPGSCPTLPTRRCVCILPP